MPSLGSPGLINSIVPVTGWYADDSTGQVQHISAGHEGQPITDQFYGPYATQAEAQAQSSSRNVTTVAENDIPGVKSTAQGVAKIGAFLEALTHPDTWRSLAWLLMGVVLMFLGIILWLKIPQKVAGIATSAAAAAI